MKMPFSSLLLVQRTLLTLGLLLLLLGGLLLGDTMPTRAQQQPTELPLYALPDSRTPAFTSGSMAFANDFRVLVVTNMLSNSVSLVSVANRTVLAEIPVGRDPRTVAVTPDSTRAVVVNRGDGTLTVLDLQSQSAISTIPVGALPYGLVLADNTLAYVAVQGEGRVALVDLTRGLVSGQIVTGGSPAALALWGDFLYVTHLWSGELSLIYLPQGRVVSTISTGADSGLSPAIELDVGRGLAYLAQTRSNADDSALTFDTTVFPVVNVINLSGLNMQRRTRIALDTADRPVNMPFALALDRFQQRLYVANAGTNNISVIDLSTGLALANIPVGANPRGLLLNRDFTQLYVHNALDATISIVQLNSQQEVALVPTSNLTLPIDVLIGAQLFHSAGEQMSTNGWISCANCHFDGLSDGRVWQGVDGGARNTPLLFGLLDSAPYTWTGAWDELADVEFKIRGLQAGAGLIGGPLNPVRGAPHAGLSLDLDALTLYLTTLTPPANPLQFPADVLARGEQIFSEQNCASCHAGTALTDGAAYDVGTGGTFDTPSLRWLWLSAPYLHDGRAATLREVFVLPGAHQLITLLPAEDLDALASYLLALP